MAKKIIEKIKKIEKEETHDVIIPVHFVDWTFFGGNIQAILKEVPIRTLFIGCNNPDEAYRETIKDFVTRTSDKIVFIDQSGIKTLGMQIADLMKRTTTELFVYCHADVRPTRHSFTVLMKDMFTEDPEDDREVGIVESDRVQYEYGKTDKPTVYPYYHFRERSFSGYQIFRMSVIKDILEKIEDDYVYRNEDIIFQNACTDAGYRYVKSFGMHIHTCSNVNHKWTPNGIGLTPKEARALTFDMQVKGIVKYCTPTVLAVKAWQDAFGICCKENGTDMFEFIEGFVRDTNPIWEGAIKRALQELLIYFWKR